MKKEQQKNAIILAAGFGMRMVPINFETPKGLVEVNGQPLIERLIEQLQEAGVNNITVVVGYLKEQFDYLRNRYDLTLVENPYYSEKNNLYSLSLVSEKIGNTFILPCDIWCKENPFLTSSEKSFYMVYDHQISSSADQNKAYWDKMTGIAYIAEGDAEWLKNNLQCILEEERGQTAFWEEALYEKDQLLLTPKHIAATSVKQINTFEDLRNADEHSVHLQSDAIEIICQVLGVEAAEVEEITALKKGMTNRSFLFSCQGKQYIMRIPGEGTDLLINRKEEAAVYKALSGYGICDDIIYINPDNGYKITGFIDSARNCDAGNPEDLIKCMARLRAFHQLGLSVEHEFNIFEQILFYENLRQGQPSLYDDYEAVKRSIFALRDYIEEHVEEKVLTHIDAVPDNFLLYEKDGEEEIRLIDWEYAGMQDPHVDVAMFSIYSLYNKEEIDRLIDIYFEGQCSTPIRLKIYCYVAACGLLWSNWCEYKRLLGVEFGDYAHQQFQYARDFAAYLPIAD